MPIDKARSPRAQTGIEESWRSRTHETSHRAGPDGSSAAWPGVTGPATATPRLSGPWAAGGHRPPARDAPAARPAAGRAGRPAGRVDPLRGALVRRGRAADGARRDDALARLTSRASRNLDVGAEGQDAGGRSDVQPEGARLVGPAVRGRVPVLEGTRRNADGRRRLRTGLGLHDGGTDQPPHGALDRAAGPAGIDLDDLAAPART